MTTPVRWGILGTSWINDKVLVGARQSDMVDVRAVASRVRDRAESYAEARSIALAFGSYEELLANPSIEAVYISLPNSLHHGWTMRAITAGKHVLCEKPYTRHAAEIEEAFAAADRAGVLLSEGFMWRHTPQTARLLELLPTIGQLETIRATFSFRLDQPDNIRLAPELAGGSLMDVGCYCVSGSRLLAGEEPERVHGEQVVGPSGVDIRFTGLLRFPSGVIAEFTSGFTTDHQGLEAIGTDGSIFLPDPWHGTEGVLVHSGQTIRVEPTNPYKLELENLSAAIRGEAVPLLGREDALGQAKTIEALYASAEQGSFVTI